MSGRDELRGWPDALEGVIAACEWFERVTVLAETDSTQDAAVRQGAVAGDVVVAGRQSRGRGRLGRQWADSGMEGIAMTCVLDRKEGNGVAIAAAVGVAAALAAVVEQSVGIKWPNDVLIDGRKISGVLVEADDRVMRVGIGVNVSQEAWPPELEQVAVSLKEVGADVRRVDVMGAVLREFDRALGLDSGALSEQFRRRDVLRGRRVRFAARGVEVEGVVEDVQPLTGLSVRTADGQLVCLDAATTSVAAILA